jgi:hypothetical protein
MLESNLKGGEIAHTGKQSKPHTKHFFRGGHGLVMESRLNVVEMVTPFDRPNLGGQSFISSYPPAKPGPSNIQGRENFNKPPVKASS